MIKKIEKLKSELAEIKSSWEFISSQYDKLKDDYSQLLDTRKKQETEIKKLKSKAIVLSSQGTEKAIKLAALEQYGGRQNLEMSAFQFRTNLFKL